MKSISFFLFTAAIWAQSATPPAVKDLPANTVVATFGDGQKLSAGELKSFLGVMPPNMQQTAQRDPRVFAEQFALMRTLAEMAEKAKLDERSPTRESLAFNRMYVLMNAQLHEVLNGISVQAADAEAFYNQNKDKFSQVKVKAIYIGFAGSNSGGTNETKRTEAEAQAKISEIRKKIAGGEDFLKAVKEYSEDKTSAAKDGDFGAIRRSDNLPDAVRSAIFALKQGEVSEPVKQGNGFYLFRAEEITAQPYSAVQEQIANELRQARFNQWMDEAKHKLNFKVENESFFAPAGKKPGA